MKLGSPVLTTVYAVDEPHSQPEQDHDRDRRPQVQTAVGHEVREQEAGAADHHPGGEVELAADHEQRHRHRDDAVLRRLIGPHGVVGDVARPVDPPRVVGKEGEHGHRADEGANVGSCQQPRDEPEVRDSLVGLEWSGRVRGHDVSAGEEAPGPEEDAGPGCVSS